MTLNDRSKKNLEGVHPDLVAVVEMARERVPFLVTEGLRTKERQAFLVKQGKSQTQNSRHLYGLAVDLCDPDGCYDIPDMHEIAKAMKAAAIELEVPIRWGGDWKSFKDTPHFELDRAKYPDKGDKKPKVVAPSTKQAAKGVAIGTGVSVGGGIAAPYLPSIPAPPVEAVSSVAGWQSAAETLGAFASSRYALYAICAMVVFGWIVPALLNKRAAQ